MSTSVARRRGDGQDLVWVCPRVSSPSRAVPVTIPRPLAAWPGCRRTGPGPGASPGRGRPARRRRASEPGGANARTPRCRGSRSTTAEAMNVFDGTQSSSTQAPPTPVGLDQVTSASSWAATSAASYPAGPPPMITIRLTTRPPRWSSAHVLFLLFAPVAAAGNRTRSGVGVCRPVFWYLAVIARSLGCRRAALCRVRVQHGPEPDDGASSLTPRWRGPGGSPDGV